jgi:hypothetical protein
MAKPEELLDDLIDSVEEDEWEPTDTGFQVAGRSYVVKLRRVGAIYELVVETYDGQPIYTAAQVQQGYSEVSGKIATLLQHIQSKPAVPVSQLDDVIKDLRSRRRSST